MRVFRILILCPALWWIVPAVAQTPSEGQAPVVLKFSWIKRHSSSAPFSTQIANSTDRLVLPDPATLPNAPPPKSYTYSVEIRNGSTRAIKAITWDYIFDEPGSKSEAGRIPFGNYEKIGANSKKSLSVRSASSPPRVVTASGLSKDKRSPFDERVEIKCVMYEDGTLWEPPGATGKPCEELRRWLVARGKIKA